MNISSLQKMLKKEKKLPLIIFDLINIRYLTGFTGTYARLIIDENKIYFISDSRYAEYAKNILSKNILFKQQEGDGNLFIKEICKQESIKQLYFEEHSLPFSQYKALKKSLRGVKLIPGEDVVNDVRMIKEPEEIEILKKAARITDRCFNHLLKYITEGMTEWEVAIEIESFYKKNGCTSVSFPSIVASGPGSSMPHYETSMTKKIQKGDVLLIDMGCVYEGYNSDMTRTVFIDAPDPELGKIYEIVKESQMEALTKARPGITTGKLDSIARNMINSAGYEQEFGHSLGHGYGLEVHEIPAVKKDGDVKIKKGMALTIEPGIYLPGKGGVRIEDMIIITKTACEVLTKSPKDIIII